MKLESIAAFVAIVDAGSISGAARQLGISKSVASERLAELERSLGATLVQRSTRRLTLSESGAVFLERARRIVRDAQDARAEIAEHVGALVGPLRISAPVSFGTLHIGPAVHLFLARHPGVRLTLELDDRFVDPATDGYDAVLRHGPVADSRLVVTRIATSKRRLVASADYVARHGFPRTIDELEQHRSILYTNREPDWRFLQNGRAVVIRPPQSLRVNNGLLMRDAAVAGLGIALLPTFLVHTEVARAALQVIDIGLEAESAEIHVIYPRGRGATVKVRAFVEHLRTHFGDPPYWDR